jgi:cardiolipin synthase
MEPGRAVAKGQLTTSKPRRRGRLRRLLDGVPPTWLRAWRVRRFEERVGNPVLPGNRVDALAGGDAAFRAVLEAIESARKGVAIEMYTWADDRLGRRIAETVRARARGGLPVFVLLDGFGSSASLDLAASLEDAGVHLLWYHPLLFGRQARRVNRRNHRKLILVDGATAFAGGVNFTEDYSTEFRGGAAWRDLMLRIQGPAVRELSRMFLATWVGAGGDVRPSGPLITLPATAGASAVQTVGGRGRRGRRTLRASYRALLATARDSVFLVSAYFAPEPWLRRELERAARRGIRVELLLAGASDVPMVAWAGRAAYARLLDAGVGIREFDRAVLHAKLAVVDDEVLLGGSANLDYRSFRHNLEVAVNVFDPAPAAAAKRAFHDEFMTARRVDPEAWARRPLHRKLGERLAYSLRYWL